MSRREGEEGGEGSKREERNEERRREARESGRGAPRGHQDAIVRTMVATRRFGGGFPCPKELERRDYEDKFEAMTSETTQILARQPYHTFRQGREEAKQQHHRTSTYRGHHGHLMCGFMCRLMYRFMCRFMFRSMFKSAARDGGQTTREPPPTTHACYGRTTGHVPLADIHACLTCTFQRRPHTDRRRPNTTGGRIVLAERAANSIHAFIQSCACMRPFGQQRPRPEGCKGEHRESTPTRLPGQLPNRCAGCVQELPN